MELKIDNIAVMELAAQKIADAVIHEDDVQNAAMREIKNRIDRLFSERADNAVSEAIDAAVNAALDRQYTRINAWGETEGVPTTIRAELEKLADAYWTQNVDAKSGKPTSSTYNQVTRAQFVMGQICAEDFTEQMKKAAVSVTAAMKDGFRSQLAKQVDDLLDTLFRVRSLQDQNKAEKPW